MKKPEELEGPPTVDSLPASALSERGDDYDDRELIAQLNKKKDWDGLLRYAQALQRQDPGGSDGTVVAAYALFRKGEYPKAIALLSPVVQRNPEDIGAWDLLGESQRKAGQPGQAVRTLERASIVGRTSFVTFFFLGEAYRDSQRLDRAISAYREATRLAPEFAQAWFELGAASARTGDRGEAKAALDTLQNLDPGLATELRKRIGR
ncbi:MAG TPA: tetratricopeptide repeat protein [Burkholderiales bacterium]|nr:tetratricopeptide repeat protein [Burkholderiales bacterium]